MAARCVGRTAHNEICLRLFESFQSDFNDCRAIISAQHSGPWSCAPPPPPPSPPYAMVQGPPSSDSEGDTPGGVEEYQYESDAEERLADTARALLREADGNYRRE